MDNEFLQKLRLLWQLGDWAELDELSKMDIAKLESRAECALYISAACFQLGLLDKANSYHTLALQWGAEKKDITRVLISGTYNSLAYASAAAGDAPASLKHFTSAAKIASPGTQLDSLIKARTQSQFDRLKSTVSNAYESALKFLPSYVTTKKQPLAERIDETININYNLDKTLGIWRRASTHDFAYSDGSETEIRIFNAVKSCEDVSIFSQELLKHQTDWASEYHFSADRANLLRPFTNQLKDAQVLELGCGCGAITRFLGECGAKVTAIEGSSQRATIAAERCRDLEDVSIILDRLQDAPFNQQFDVVTLIGVLEYSRIYVNAEDPVQYVLEKARSYLKPDGILIVAIENQLGLKYFAGAPEDHGVGIMAGINDVYASNTPVTFGKQELERRFLNAGFIKCDTYLPFPDYKLPCLIVHPEGSKYHEDFDLGNLLIGTIYYDRQGITNPLFSLENCWPLINRNGLVADLANSHLFVVHNNNSPWQTAPAILASYYSPKRSSDTSQEIIFHRKNDKVSLIRRRLSSESVRDSTLEPYVSGILHSRMLHQIVQRPGWTLSDIEKWMQLWLDALEQAALIDIAAPNDWPKYDKWLPSNYIDALPRNLIINSNGFFQFIDLEWELPHPIPMPLILYRGLAITLSTITSIAEPQNVELIQRQALLNQLMLSCGYNLSAEDYALFVPLIESLSRKAQGKSNADPLPSQPFSLMPFKVRTAQGVRVDSNCSMTLYWRHLNTKFCEENTIKYIYPTHGKQQNIDLSLPPSSQAYTRLRLDIAEKPGFFQIDELSLHGCDGEFLWAWDFNLSQVSNIGELDFYLKDNSKSICLVSKGFDPQFELDVPANVLDSLSKGGLVRIKILAQA